MAASSLSLKKTKKGSTKLEITSNDSKILAHVDRRRDKVIASQQMQTNKLKTYCSAWTPVVHKPSNQQIFKERRDLVSHWFDLWTDSQRKRFFEVLFLQCSGSQYRFVQNWFQDRVPLQHLDFTTVLPRCLSVYLFSFLEPKSLSRAAQVSWHWKFLSEQDDIWMTKCLKYGWFLPYTAPDNEYGAWKRHYVACVQTLDYVVGEKKQDLYGTRSTTLQKTKPSLRSRSGRLSPNSSRLVLTTRPPWQGPDHKPNEFQLSHRAFLNEYNPNQPRMDKSALVAHNRWGIVTKHLSAAVTRSMDLGLEASGRKERHRMLTSGEDYDLQPDPKRLTLTESLDLENYSEHRLRELMTQPWMYKSRTSARRPDLSGGGVYPASHKTLSMTTPPSVGAHHPNPRLILISSRIPASELLLDAVQFGVIPVAYEYEGTTLDSLVSQVERLLEGRHAQSIGLFCHNEEPGEIRIVHGYTVDLESMDDPEIRNFFESMSNHILPTNNGGQFDLFMPLAASEEGMELIVQLNILTGMQFSSPTGVIGRYNHINTEWLISNKSKTSTPSLYLCSSKISVWANVADQALDALSDCRRFLSPFFDRVHRDISSQLAGQVIFDVLGQTDIQGVGNITEVLTNGLMDLGKQKNVKPLEFLGKYLLSASGISDDKLQTLQIPRTTPEDAEVELITSGSSSKLQSMMYEGNELEEDEDVDEDVDEEVENVEHVEQEETKDENGDAKKDEGKEKGTKKEDQESVFITQRERYGTFRTHRLKRLTVDVLADHPEKRTPIAMEILSSEVQYYRSLKAINDVYVKPLKAALSSSRAIISAQNVQIIFSDVMSILQASGDLVEDLKNRLADWNPQETCIGDVFIKFSTRLKVYTNFINNYEDILRSVEKCKEQTPSFRAFLMRHNRIPSTRMMTLPELLLLPTRRAGEYVTLLSWFKLHTPANHPDRSDLDRSIDTLRELDRCIRECKMRMQRDREMVSVQKKIQNCPVLLEANRYLVKHLDVAHLRPPSDSIVPELRVYQQTETYGLFLFNDAMVITRRTSRHFPFSRAIEHSYKFEASIALVHLKVDDIPDSKYITHAFLMETPKRQWHCSADNADDKFNWISLLEKAIRTTLEDR